LFPRIGDVTSAADAGAAGGPGRDIVTVFRLDGPPRCAAERKDIGAGGVVDYQVEVDFFDSGSIDSYLNFTEARGPSGNGPAAGEPVEQRTYETLVLRDGFVQRKSSGKDVEKKGKLGWRMALFASPRIDVNAALRWVGEMRDKSNDPAIKYNAEKTLAILRALSVGGPVRERTEGIAGESPAKIAQRFIRLEAGLFCSSEASGSIPAGSFPRHPLRLKLFAPYRYHEKTRRSNSEGIDVSRTRC
jgi:hypothetical protein